MKLIRTIAALSFLSILFFLSRSAYAEIELPQANFEDMRRTMTGRITEIINPLTVKMEDGEIIHLAGLDYPDLDYYEPGDIAVTAIKILEDFLTDKDVTLYQTKSKDKGRINRFGHHIAHIVRKEDNVWTQGLLLALGTARVRTTEYNLEMAKQMLAIEDKARINKNGLWEENRFPVLTPKQANDKIGTYQVIEGNIKSVSMRKNRLYLNFGNNWREDFTVSISSFDLKKFTRQKINPQNWSGKRIRVRGWIESYNGPYIKIDHPERFEAIFEQDLETPKVTEKTPKKPKKATKKKTKKNNALPTYN